MLDIGTALGRLFIDPAFWRHLGTTAMKVAGALAIGGGLGITAGELGGLGNTLFGRIRPRGAPARA